MFLEILDAPPPHEAHQRLAQRFGTTFILESRDGPERLARYSFVGWAPAATIIVDKGGLTVTGAAPEPLPSEGAIPYLRRLLTQHATTDHTTPFVGGLVGLCGFDLIRDLEDSLPPSADVSPRLQLGLYLDCLVYDHQESTCTYMSRAGDRRADLDALRDAGTVLPLQVGALTTSSPQGAFAQTVAEAKQLIAAGECFQIVLSRSYRGRFSGDLGACYAWLREHHRVPYLYHLRFSEGDPTPPEPPAPNAPPTSTALQAAGGRPPSEKPATRTLIGASPEMLVRVRVGVAETVPIAGTRPVTGIPAIDDAAAKDLLADAKERAEHAMLVDLARNDLGRVSRPGTVNVTEYAQIAKFGPVQHLVSRVTGRLEPGKDALDALAALFPAGTVSGAPKLRAIEHITRLEKAARGPYAGCVLYASFNGDLDSAITIRSVSAVGNAKGGELTVQAGAGIVAGSSPDAEFAETQRKASTILQGLQTFGATVQEGT